MYTLQCPGCDRLWSIGTYVQCEETTALACGGEVIAAKPDIDDMDPDDACEIMEKRKELGLPERK